MRLIIFLFVNFAVIITISIVNATNKEGNSLVIGGCSADSKSQLLYSQVINFKNVENRRWYERLGSFIGISPPAPKKCINATFVYPPHVSDEL